MKIVQLLMVCAIFNPFCCCTAGVLVDDSVASTSTHSCCRSDNEQSSTSSQDSHNPDQCPHQVLKDYQALSLKEVATSQDSVNCLPMLYVMVDLVVHATNTPTFAKLDYSTAAHVPPRPVSQLYCVYRI